MILFFTYLGTLESIPICLNIYSNKSCENITFWLTYTHIWIYMYINILNIYNLAVSVEIYIYIYEPETYRYKLWVKSILSWLEEKKWYQTTQKIKYKHTCV